MTRRCFYSVLLIIALLAGCDTNDPENIDDQVAGIRMLPDSVSIEPGEQVQFSIAAVNESGEELEDHDLDLRWWSTDTEVFTVSENGTAVAQDAGTAWCMAEIEAFSKNLRFVGRDSAFVTVLF